MSYRPSREIKVSGYFIEDETKNCAKKTKDQGRFPCDDEPDDEFEEPEVMEDGGARHTVHAPRPKLIQRNNIKKTEDFEVASSSRDIKWKQISITGPFFLTSPWWQVEMQAKQTFKGDNTKEYAHVSNLHYSLKDSDSSFPFLLLTKCKVEPQFIQTFKDWLMLNGKLTSLTLSTIKSLIEEFAESENGKKCARQMERCLESNSEMKLVDVGIKHPNLLHHLPAIFPKQYHVLLTREEEILENLQEILETAPYMFGFRRMLTNRGIIGCEASVGILQQCSFYRDISSEIQTALHVYDIIKEACKEGHTYLLEDQLLNNKLKDKKGNTDLKKKIRVQRNNIKREWFKVQSFFKQNPGILTFQRVDEVLHIHHGYYLMCEERISEHLDRLMHQSDPLILNHDKSKNDYDTFGGDECQVRAAELIRRESVVILSGGGGCGKTHVLSEVLKEHQMIEQARRAECEESGESEKIDENTECHKNMENVDCKDEKITGMDNRKLAENGEDTNDEKQTESVKESGDEDKIVAEGHAILTDELNRAETEQKKGKNNEEEEAITKNEKLMSVNGEILLTAPTGKAATILRNRTSLPSSTLHKVLYSFYKVEDVDHWKYKHVRILVVDESSMVDLAVLSQVLYMLVRRARLQKVILLGDIHQLPSIGPGNVFMDLYKACYDNRIPIISREDLVNNHRAESQVIVNNALRIRHQLMPVFDDENFIWINARRDAIRETEEAFDKFLKGSSDPTIKDHQRSQVISFTRKYCQSLNDLCCRYYNNHTVKHPKNGLDFKVDDKICCTKNAEVIDWEKEDNDKKVRWVKENQDSKKEEQMNNPTNLLTVSNGEVFFIKQDKIIEDELRNTCSRWLLSEGRDKHGKQKTILVDTQSMFKLAKVRHAWARTIHTFQGSEAETVVYVVGSPYFSMNWQHIYTAVTRGRCRVYIVGTINALKAAIDREPPQRQTFLCTLLKRYSGMEAVEVENPQETSNGGEESRQNNIDSTFASSTFDTEPPITSPPSDMTEAPKPSKSTFSLSPEASKLAKSFPNSSFAQSLLRNGGTKTPTKRPYNQAPDTPKGLLATPSKKLFAPFTDIVNKRSPRACFRLSPTPDPLQAPINPSQSPPGNS